MLVENYGKGYNYSNLQRFKKFYLQFPIVAPVEPQLTWTNIKLLLPIDDGNKRNYYVNQVITKNLPVRKLIDEIKSNSYERLVNKPKRIGIISTNKITSLEKNKKPNYN